MKMPKAKMKRKYSDLISLLAAALLLTVAGVTAFIAADHYRIAPVWMFAAAMAMLFIAVVGKDFRGRLRSWQVVFFLSAWLLVYLLSFALCMLYWSIWVWVVTALPLILFIGYYLARRLFDIRIQRRASAQVDE